MYKLGMEIYTWFDPFNALHLLLSCIFGYQNTVTHNQIAYTENSVKSKKFHPNPILKLGTPFGKSKFLLQGKLMFQMCEYRCCLQICSLSSRGKNLYCI